MAVPDALTCIRSGLKSFTRVSEYEKIPSFYEDASGIWIDCFDSDWIQENDVLKHLQNGKKFKFAGISYTHSVGSKSLVILSTYPEERERTLIHSIILHQL